ncbi:DUF4115 domain-containing protein [Roseofilum reptotaenium CS-1145]|uniref:Cytoskeleton protein RodZ-like C-terminal domain-containing protein n=1 Tax=Roseofilum reptotaenium AO1-A TaxID=1925591 RepID=A0A1L9QQT1_9CYAN|nr:RodZ domain-containing protein [Roseofilum reptotaenium]MDB9516219.1 DUF4115 domain-containing protein [Roseofilum reptotaenium CS-1145]OJJ24947.1 hypothetical protein BI308_13765 [Roseofilum reptotaenium AO1-A]
MKKQKTIQSSVNEFDSLKSVLIDLGSQLRDRRQEKGLSLDHIATKTRIRQRLLGAIEEGKLEQLPEPVYVHYFLRRYADFLGLDGSSFASPFPSESRFNLLKASWMRWPMWQLRPVHLYLLYVAIIFGSVNGLSYWIERSVGSSVDYLVEQPAPEIEAIASSPPSPPSVVPSESSPASLVVKSEPDPNSIEPVRVSVIVTEPSWILIEADGETAFEGTLTEGTQQTWVANQKLIIVAGNAGAVSVALNEGKSEKLGEPGAVEEVIFTANQLSRS